MAAPATLTSAEYRSKYEKYALALIGRLAPNSSPGNVSEEVYLSRQIEQIVPVLITSETAKVALLTA